MILVSGEFRNILVERIKEKTFILRVHRRTIVNNYDQEEDSGDFQRTYKYIDGGSKGLDRAKQEVKETRSSGNGKLE